MSASPGPEIVHAWGWEAAELVAIPGGLINASFAVRIGGASIAVLQRLHPIFDARVNLDIDAVTTHLAARGLTTPRLIRTRQGEGWVISGGDVWRALTWIDGMTVHRVPDPRWAETGGELVGAFHRALADFRHDYAFVRTGVHDTAGHLDKLRRELSVAGDRDLRELGEEIIAMSAELPQLPPLPLRHCHGDLKISNLVFASAGVRAVGLVDLDTVGFGTLAFELGDAMRSWCNPHGEDASEIRFELPIFAAAIRGVRASVDGLFTRDEWASIVTGLETVCVELAARFAVDVFRDEYFGWDPTRFATRRAHNVVRARGQLALARAVRAARTDALSVALAGA